MSSAERGSFGIGGRLALAAAALIGVVWLTGAASAWLFGGGWEAMPLSDAVGTIVRLPRHLADPRLAWPRAGRAMIPGAFAVYATFATLLGTLGGAALLASRLRGRWVGHGGSARRRPASSRWASWWELRELRVGAAHGRRVVLGRYGTGLLAAEERQSVIVVAPTQSGKTSGLAVPALLEWSGPVVATSIKTDLLNDSFARRAELGEVMVFDPARCTGMASARATPLVGCTSWRGALRVAHWLASSARTDRRLEDGDFWNAAAEKLLAPLLFAAASGGLLMADVVRWLDEGPLATEEVEMLLSDSGVREAQLAWGATWNRDERQRASIYTTAETILAAFADPYVLEATSGADYTPARLLDGRANTLYLCAPAHEQERLRPLFSMIVRELLAVVYESAASSGKPLDPPLLLALDEAANIAPIPNLDQVAASGAGQGVQLLSVFQDFAQVRARYGDRAQTILNNHRAKVFGPGVSDPETLSYVSRVVGSAEFEQRSQTEGEPGRSSTTHATTYRDLAPASAVREAAPGSALLLYGHLPPARIRLRPWYRDRGLRRLAEARAQAPEREAV